MEGREKGCDQVCDLAISLAVGGGRMEGRDGHGSLVRALIRVLI